MATAEQHMLVAESTAIEVLDDNTMTSLVAERRFTGGVAPRGTRMIVRRERPHPGAQLSIFDTIEGLRHQAFITDTPRPACSVQLLELRHSGHARVEDRIRTGKDTGFGRFPSRQFAISQAWLDLALIGIDLLARTRTLLPALNHVGPRADQPEQPKQRSKCPLERPTVGSGAGAVASPGFRSWGLRLCAAAGFPVGCPSPVTLA